MIGGLSGRDPLQENCRRGANPFVDPCGHQFLLPQGRPGRGAAGRVTNKFRHRDQRFIRGNLEMLEHVIGQGIFDDLVARRRMRDRRDVAAKSKNGFLERRMLLIERMQHLLQPGALDFRLFQMRAQLGFKLRIILQPLHLAGQQLDGLGFHRMGIMQPIDVKHPRLIGDQFTHRRSPLI
jgi:hypothetical protein